MITRFQLSEELADVSKWGGFVTITTRKGACARPFISEAVAGRLLTASRKAELGVGLC